MNLFELSPNLINSTVRIHSIEMTNFRNIEHSKIVFPNSELDSLKEFQPSILGLYGQNGSGKTSVVMALGLLKTLVSGISINNKYESCIRHGCDRATLSFDFSAIKSTKNDGSVSDVDLLFLEEISKNTLYEISYTFDIVVVETPVDRDGKQAKSIQIENEQLAFKTIDSKGNVISPKQIYIDTSDSVCIGKIQAFGSKSKHKLLTQGDTILQSELFKAKAVTKAQSKSFIFSNDFFSLIMPKHMSIITESEELLSAFAQIGGVFIMFSKIDDDDNEELQAEIISCIKNVLSSNYISSICNIDTATIESADEDTLFEMFVKSVFGMAVALKELFKINIDTDSVDTTDMNEVFDLYIKINQHDKIKDFGNIGRFIEVLCTLSSAISDKLHVIDTFSMGVINVNKNLPLVLRIKKYNSSTEQYEATYQTIPLKMDEETKIDIDSYAEISDSIDKLSQVLSKIIPELTLEIKDCGIRFDENEEKRSIEVISCRDGIRIPLKYESDGIRRLISILSPLIGVYNDPSIILAVDEIDSGLFEYLLGEILQIMASSSKGQLIFTSHNLRPLEVLPSKYLEFTTVNASNRYTSIANRGNSNLRDTYFRNIVLGSKSDDVYRSTDQFEIEQAFIIAGR